MPHKIELTAENKSELLLQIGRLNRDTLDLEEILNHLLDVVESILEYDAAGIFVLSRDIVYSRTERPRTMIAGIARRGFDPGPPERDAMLTRGEGIVGHVIASREAVVLPDVRRDPRYVVGRRATLSEIAVPIVKSERAIGALNLENDRPGAFDAGDLDVLRFFAEAAAISIEKAMLHRQLLERDRVQEQLQTAREVQARLLPDRPPEVPGYQVAGLSVPTYDIGGDYFDYLPLAADRLGVVVADVSGQGVPAALVMAGFRALLRTHADLSPDPAEVAGEINRLLPEFIGRADFVTAVIGMLYPADDRLVYTNAGHNLPLLVRGGGAVEKLQEHGPAMGVFPGAEYGSVQVTLGEGDVLVLYTDGVVETADPQGRLWGVDRLAEMVGRARGLPAAAIVDEVLKATQAFAGAEGYEDDFTLVVIKKERP